MTATTYDFEFWQRPPMTFRIYVMWALGNLVWVLLAMGRLGWVGVQGVIKLRPFVFVWGVLNDIADGALNDPLPTAPVQMREPGWALREYKERMEIGRAHV